MVCLQLPFCVLKKTGFVALSDLWSMCILCFFFFQAEDGIRDRDVTGVQTCALPIYKWTLLIPWKPFDPSKVHLLEGAAPQNVEMFYWIYFAMTGMHAVHMVIGVGLLSVILYFAWRGRYGPEYHNPVEISGLYWHFVDIIWIFLFPLLYL